MIRWDDDGTLTVDSDGDPGWIKVSEVEVTVGREDFATACVGQPERTARMHAHLARQQADAALKKDKELTAAAKQSCGVCTRRVCTYRGPCRLRCKFCCFELSEYQPVDDHRVPDFLEMLGSVAMPTADAWLDWSVTIAFYLAGDVHWFEAGLTINLLSGLLSGGGLAWFLRNPHRSPAGISGEDIDDHAELRAARVNNSEQLKSRQRYRWRWWKAAALVLLVGLPGLAPAACVVMVLCKNKDIDLIGGESALKVFKAAELVIENVPQSVLQTYVGVAYGKFDPSSPTFSYLLPVSVTVSLLGAGSTVFGLEAEMRNADAKKEVVTLGSRYGIVGLLLRTAQVTALIFWISLLGCAEKGWAVVAVVLGVLVFGGMCAEAAYRHQSTHVTNVEKEFQQPESEPEPEPEPERPKTNGKGKWAMVVTQMPPIQWRIIHLWQKSTSTPVRASLLWSAIHLALLGAMAAVFFDVQHVPNNYANKTLLMGNPGDPQHYDCHDRTSGLYPAYLASAACVLLAPLYAALDPEHGVVWLRGKPVDERLKEQNAATERRIRAVAMQKETDVPLEKQVEALWMWAEGTVSDGNNPDAGGRRIVKRGTVVEFAKVAGMEPETMCELLGAEPVRGPRAVLGGRAGTVIAIHEMDEGEKIQVRWEDDGTLSPWDDSYYPDAIKVSELDEPLGEGSAVRHDGRRGTAATDPRDAYGDGERITIRWEDDGTLSGWIKVSELEVEVTVGREDFAAACAGQPERTARLHAGLLLMTIPGLNQGADAAVLEAKIAAVWRWADAVECGFVGATELRRLADRVVTTDRHGNSITDAEEKYKELCEALGLRPRAVLGGRVGTVIDQEERDGVEKIQVRWEDDGTESPDTLFDDAIKVSDLDEPLAGGWLDPEVSIGRETLAAACRAQKPDFVYTVSSTMRSGWVAGKRPVEVWLEALRLELEEPGPGCLASAIASWPLRILCIALAALLVCLSWLGDDDDGSFAGSSSDSGSFGSDLNAVDWDGPAMCIVLAVAVSIILWDVNRIRVQKRTTHKDAAEKSIKEAAERRAKEGAAQTGERKRKRREERRWLEERKRDNERKKQQKRAAALAAATEQLQDVAGVAVEGLPQPKLNDVYLPAGDHEGWPRFESGQGKRLYYTPAKRRWRVSTKLDCPTSDAYCDVPDGLLPLRGQTWQVYDDGWKDTTLTVSLLQSAEEVVEQTERLWLALEAENVKDFMKARGLEAWHGHLTKHLDIKTPRDLKAITAVDLRRMATAANMRLDQKTIDQVLQAIRRNPRTTDGSMSSSRATYSSSSSSGETVEAYLKRVGLDAWRTHFQTHLPANCKSVALVRATTKADLRRMGTKANMRLDNATIQQVVDALGKKPLATEEWTRYTCGERSYYRDSCGAFTLETPAAVAREKKIDDEATFERRFVRAGKMDSGELNSKSPWDKYTCGDRAYYYNTDTKAYSLQVPAEGFYEEKDEKLGKFERHFTTASKMDAGELSPQSRWGKYTCGDRCYFYNFDAKTYSLDPPPEGVCEEEEEEADRFEKHFAKAGPPSKAPKPEPEPEPEPEPAEPAEPAEP
eukprot:COSAG04_NODE_227_length_19396_cov_29.887547_13_plen_1562_part_00